MTGFHETLFPLDIAAGARGGPERRTVVVATGSGREERNQRWAHARRRYNAGTGVKTLDQLHAVLAFFEERRGRLYGFRYRDRADWKSCPPSGTPAPGDQRIGTGDGATAVFQLAKTYGASFAPYQRPIEKPHAESVRVAVNGTEVARGPGFTVEGSTGRISFAPAHVPPPGASVTAGFSFDVPVRFDADLIEVDLSAFSAGEIPNIPMIEIRG